MKTIYLVKKNPDLSSEDNWIEMSYSEFVLFLETAEGQRRKKLFSIIDPTDRRDTRIVIEADPDMAKLLHKEHFARKYRARCQKESGYSSISYNAIGENGEDLTGEELISDETCDVEEQAIKNLEAQRLRDAISQLSDFEQVIIHTAFFSKVRLTNTQCARQIGIARSTLWRQKPIILTKLKKILENTENRETI